MIFFLKIIFNLLIVMATTLFRECCSTAVVPNKIVRHQFLVEQNIIKMCQSPKKRLSDNKFAVGE